MSTLNVNNIDKESGSTLTIGGSGTTVNVSNMVPDVALSNRNLIINGAMQVAQRATQVTGATTTNYYTCDRWRTGISTIGTWTIDQSTDAPNGFSNSLKMTCTIADASPAAGDACVIQQRIEAQNLQHLGFGTADAKSMTLSFWVKSNKTGNASVEAIQDDNSSKMFSNSYTINSANTWEYKTISIPADTAGVINNDNGLGVQFAWWLNSGSDFTGGSYATTWSTFDNTRRNPSNLGVGGAINDYFAITGVQLEVGDVATPFEHESYGQTLAKCQRYYYQDPFLVGVGYTSTQVSRGTATHPIEMRASPSISIANTALFFNGTQVVVATGVITSNYSTVSGVSIDFTVGSGSVQNAATCYLDLTSKKITVDAEL